MKRILWGLGFPFLAFLFMGCNKLSERTLSPEQVVDSFYHSVQAGEFAHALTFSTLDGDEADEVIDLLDNMGLNVCEYQVLGSTIDEGDTTATVQLYLSVTNALSSDTTASEIDIPCVKYGKRWRVQFM